MTKNIRVGIDIGTYQVKVMMAGRSEKKDELLSILGTGLVGSYGLRYGYIVNKGDVVRAIKKAIGQAEKSSGNKIRKAYLGISGITLEGTQSTGNAVISRADMEITDLDVKKAIEDSEQNLLKKLSPNRKIIHTIPIEWKIDKKLLYGRPSGIT